MGELEFFKDIAAAYYSMGLHYLKKLRTGHEKESIDEIYDYILENLEPGEIQDQEDLVTYVARFKSLQRVIEYLHEARSQNFRAWLLPLLKECYSACGMEFNRRKVFTIPKVIPQGYQIFYDAFRKDNAPTADIFIIPHMADIDLGSIAMIGHEFGHILIGENKGIIQEEISKSLREKRTEKKDIITRHVSEYICDMVGSRLFGPAFDLYFLRIFLTEINSKTPTETHPALIHRMKLALARLSRINSTNPSLNTTLTQLKNSMKDLCQECEKYAPNENEKDFQQLAKNIFQCFFLEKIIPIDLEKAWEKVVPELDGFRPPCETVNDDYPVPINPREIVVASSLYYYGDAYKNTNDFYNNSTEQDELKSRSVKESLARHVSYAIEISDFVTSANSQISDEEKKSLVTKFLPTTLWALRSDKKDQLIVVPTISPAQQYSTNAIDLRLGSAFLVNKLPLFTHIQPKKFFNNEEDQIAFEYGMFDPVHVPIGKDFILHPHQFVLACTLEYICLPKDKYAFALGRSTWGRLGLTIATATTVQPGFRGCLTLELRNLGETPLPLTVGTRIAQLAVVSVPIDIPKNGKEYFSSGNKYIGPVGVGLPKIKDDPDWKIIAKFTENDPS